MDDIPQHFNDLVHKIAQEQKFANYDLDVKPISSGGANYTSKLYTVTISEGSRVLQMFAKIAAVGEQMRAHMPKLYDTERYFYTKLDDLYEKIENDFKLPDEHKLAFPKFYGCNPAKYEETVVLENLVVDGYLAYDRMKAIDWPYASSAVKELAKFHAVSFAHWKYYPENFETVMEEFKFDFNMGDDGMKRHMETVTSRAIDLVDEQNKAKLARFFEAALSSPESFAPEFKKSRRPVLGHGDYRPSNLMHKNLDDGKVEIKIVDLQTLQAGSPVTDLLYFIFTGSDEEFRAKYFDKLIDHYYTELSAAMRRLSLNPDEIFSREDFDFELKEKLPFGLTLAVFTLPVITVDTANAPEVNENLDISNFAIEKTSDLYAERLNGVVNDYVKWGILT
ncbi:hypothetical protein PYW07_005511 [Mythimna separata]|uniref:CHK kinase-like domain-containing protein n=1 Tax=Mythimna separata TaxID=271217 RepID=A0AAD7YK13_MYTSE|nr:hypothetical protein PYW07_005511 [Mythimna separata]